MRDKWRRDMESDGKREKRIEGERRKKMLDKNGERRRKR